MVTPGKVKCIDNFPRCNPGRTALGVGYLSLNDWWHTKKNGPISPVSRVKQVCAGAETSVEKQKTVVIRHGLRVDLFSFFEIPLYVMRVLEPHSDQFLSTGTYTAISVWWQFFFPFFFLIITFTLLSSSTRKSFSTSATSWTGLSHRCLPFPRVLAFGFIALTLVGFSVPIFQLRVLVDSHRIYTYPT